MMRFPNIIRRKFGAEDGNSAIDTVIVLPIFLFLFVSIFELGLAMTRLTTLEQSVDKTMRDIRLTANATVDHEEIRSQICDSAILLKDCESSLLVELTQIKRGSTWTTPKSKAACIDKSIGEIIPVTRPSTGLPNDVVMMRACYVVEPLFPTFGLGQMLETDAAGNMQLVAYSAFAKEPN